MTTLSAGDKAPDLTLPDPDGMPVALSALAGQKVVLYFYPTASTPGCKGPSAAGAGSAL